MDVVMPQLGETVTEGTVTRWHRKVGDAVRADDVLFEIETDKVSMEIPAPASGVLAEILVTEGVAAKVGARLAVIRESGQAAHAPSPTTTAGATAASRGGRAEAPPDRRESAGAAERLSPVVRKLVSEHKLDPRAIAGSGRDGRVTREDVLAHVAQRGGAAPTARTEERAPQAGAGAGEEVVPLNSIRKRVAERMARSWTTTPHVLQAVEADYSRVEQARRAAGAQWKSREGFSLTYLPFIARAVVLALAKYPRLNANFGGDHLVVHRRVNLGIAVDLDFEGLLVPVVKDAAGKSLSALARAINDLARRAREGKLKPDDMTGGTYTISNNGAFGTVFTAPIINPPQVAVLSTDAVRKRALVVETEQGDTIEARPAGMLAQSFDHRAVDGAYSAAFLGELKTIIETRDWQKELQG